jgi:hypothetical protein
MASKGILAAKQAQAAADQAKFLALVNAKLDLLLAQAGIQFNDDAFLNQEAIVEEVPADSTEEAAGTLPEETLPDVGTGEEVVAKVEEAAASSKKK